MARRRNDEDSEISGINVTPLVDIMLVLLVIFLVTTTYIVKEAIKIDLPRAAAATSSVTRTLQLLVTKEGQVFLDGAPADDGAIVRKIQDLRREQHNDLQAVIGADRDARHGWIVHLLDLIKDQGVTSFAIEVDKDTQRELGR